MCKREQSPPPCRPYHHHRPENQSFVCSASWRKTVIRNVTEPRGLAVRTIDSLIADMYDVDFDDERGSHEGSPDV